MIAALYIAAFLLQLGGVGLIVVEIRDDLAAARRITTEEPPAAGISYSEPGIQVRIGGVLGAGLARTSQSIDTFRTFTAERLTGGLGRRISGVALIVAGAVADLLANLLAL